MAILGGAGSDSIRAISAISTRIDGGPDDDSITAIASRGQTRVTCGAGDDTVTVLSFKGNRKFVTLDADCEHIMKG